MYLTYRIIHHLCGDLSKSMIQLFSKSRAHRLNEEEIVTRVLGCREHAFGPL